MCVMLFQPGMIQTLLRRCFHLSKEIPFQATHHVTNFKNSDQGIPTYINPPLSIHVIMKILHKFEKDKSMLKEAKQHGITKSLFRQSMKSFKHACSHNQHSMVTMQLRHIIHGISTEKYPLKALLPFFLNHSHQVFPALKQHKEMKELSDLSQPTLWYPKAREITRDIVFHAGPTNSGKTHAALQRFFEAENAIYCSPLRLLAREICDKSRSKGIACDMITGDDQDYDNKKAKPASRLSCTIEMTDINKRYDVAIIDEIQMLTDIERGWAWTRALLGLCAKEIHVCGEERAANIVCLLADECNDNFEILNYQRLGQLRVKKKPVERLKNLRPGDCIVCFSKDEIYSYKNQLANQGIEVAVIYGSLPPQTKREEAKKFNDPSHPCNILVTTDAIGMGLNLNIKRIIFNDIKKTTLTGTGDKRIVRLSTSQALQISGRAGRYGSQYPDGCVTAMHEKHQETLLKLLKNKSEIIKQAGLLPNFERLERFADVMKTSSLYDVLSVFISMCETDSNMYFVCSMKDCLEITQFLSPINMSMRDMYTFSLSPVSPNKKSVMAALQVYAEFYAKGWTTTDVVVKEILSWPPQPANTKQQMMRLEDIHESLRLYLWLSYRFPRYFTSSKEIRAMRKKVDYYTQLSVSMG